MRAYPLGLLVAGICALDVGLYAGLPIRMGEQTNPSSPFLVFVVPVGIVGGFVYGWFLTRRVTRSLEKTGVFRATRRRLVATLIVVVVVLFAYFWFSGFLFPIQSRLFVLEFSVLASMFGAQSIAYVRWERRNGKSIEYAGVWGLKAVERIPVRSLTLEHNQ